MPAGAFDIVDTESTNWYFVRWRANVDRRQQTMMTDSLPSNEAGALEWAFVGQAAASLSEEPRLHATNELKDPCPSLVLKGVHTWADMATWDAIHVLRKLESGQYRTVVLGCKNDSVRVNAPTQWQLYWELYHLALLWEPCSDVVYLDWGRSGGTSRRWQTMAHWMHWGVESEDAAYDNALQGIDDDELTFELSVT